MKDHSCIKNNKSLGDIKIRQATLDDTHHIAKIKIENHGGDSSDPLEQILNDVFIREYTKRWEKKFHDGERTLILSVDNKTCGLISYNQCDDENNSHEKYAEIHNIYVSPEQRGHHFGSLLCKTAIEQMQQDGFTKVILWIVDGRLQTRKFYEAMGFTITSCARFDAIDEHVVVKEIKFEMDLQK